MLASVRHRCINYITECEPVSLSPSVELNETEIKSLQELMQHNRQTAQNIHSENWTEAKHAQKENKGYFHRQTAGS